MTFIQFLVLLALIPIIFYVYRIAKYSGKIKPVNKSSRALSFLNGKESSLFYVANLKYGMDPYINTNAAFTCNKFNYKPRREMLKGADGGEFGVDWFDLPQQEKLSDKAPIVIFVHGINGGSHERYLSKCARRCANCGWRTACVICRGCCGTTLTTLKTYNGGNTEDIHIACREISKRYPQAPITIVGYSLGGNMVAKYLGEQKSKNVPYCRYQHIIDHESVPKNVICGIVVGNPFDLKGTNEGISIKEQLTYGAGLWKHAMKHEESLKSVKGFTEYKAAKKHFVRDFDKIFTCQFYGYDNPEQFYEDASSKKYLDGVSVPLLCISYRNDPVSIFKCFPEMELSKNPNIGALVFPGGGHLGGFATTSSKKAVDEDLVVKMIKFESEKWVKERKLGNDDNKDE
ncbi:putative Alpha/beta hydrolase family containing protein [Monocercomonoides exilis]|uniref:putative Alpha/beta hydrolase family containing protein n=1 Tax=Monocercomonoides exilis TaxID=2049356 RepID=UPI00355A0FC2|nr:putative Alpha/beta hydrolase family containing protein [Monocercomonoides exilis]|eukprot:MONOS_2080.1-p1 / transcript=MONOS_2080.1 / gene=MONOS_2080 / organism=Monocercomonoides_exilis_PA203 / gene_product=Alpha/beta hydrolase family containing protein / transcript_product=Alpha/beta hydrolase family containing protein / location=Mono_scaffold00040:186701-187906(+) / protein_length=402 / sequence_SO=supercontig / SO=protein_coding / is_pseudo=false